MATSYYSTNPHKRQFLGHLSLGVKSYPLSKIFYTSLFAPFGLSLVFDDPSRKVLGFGLDADHEVLNIFEVGDAAGAAGPGTHIAFNATSRKCVREFWEAAMTNGGTDGGKPGIREVYGRNYFAAFVRDLDGHKLEAVFQDEVDDDEEDENGES